MDDEQTLRFREFEICGLQITRRSVPVDVERRVFDLVLYLIRHRDRVVPKDELIEQVWKLTSLSDSAVARCVSVARRTFDDPECIQSTYGRGYRWMVPISVGPGDGTFQPSIKSIFGRDRELGLGGGLVRRAAAGDGGICLVSGEAGIGKTRFLGALGDLANEHRMRVLSGKARETEATPPYWPWSQILLKLFERDSKLPAPVNFLVSGRTETQPPNESRVLFLEAVAEAIADKTRSTPTAIFLDDLHYADMGALLLLEFVAERVGQSHLLLAGAYRPVELDRDAAKNACLQRSIRGAASLVLELRGLTLEATGEFLEARTGTAPPVELARRAHELTGGNPFFLEQVLHLVDATREGWVTKDIVRHLPSTVRASIENQLGTVSAECRSMLDVASVIGRVVPAQVVAHALEWSVEKVSRHVREARSFGLVTEGTDAASSFAFVHDLVREVVYDALTASDRAERHLVVARALDATDRTGASDLLAEIAHHYGEAILCGGAEHAVTYAVRAAEAAFARFAYEAAREHLSRALVLLDQTKSADTRARCAVLVDLGRAELNSGNPGGAWEVFERAVDLALSSGDDEPLLRIALALTGTFHGVRMDYDPKLVRLLEGLLTRTDRGQPRIRALLLSRLTLTLCWFPDQSRRAALAEEAHELVQQVDDPRVKSSVSVARYLGLEHPGDLTERLRVSEEAVSLCQASEELELMQYALVIRMMALAEAGQLGEVRDGMRAMGELQRRLRLRNASSLIVPLVHRSFLAHLEGRLDDFADIASETYDLATRTGDGDPKMSADSMRAMLLLERARPGDALDTFRIWPTILPGSELFRSYLSMLTARAGQSDEALALLRGLTSNASEPQRDWQWLACMSMLSEACAQLRDQAAAAVLYRRLSSYRDRCIVIGAVGFFFGSVHRALAPLADILGNPEVAHDHFEQAHAVHSKVGGRLMLAHSLCEHALLLERAPELGHQQRATELRRNAENLAAQLGLVHVQRKLAGQTIPDD